MALLGIVGLIALLGTGVLGYLLAQAQSDDSSTEATDVAGPSIEEDTATSSAVSSDDSATGDDESDDDSVAVEVEGTESDDGDQAQSEAPADQASPSGPITNESGRRAVFRQGVVYLEGVVPSEEVGAIIEQKAAAVVGPENVVNNYEIDPTAVVTPGESSPLYVEDVVLFKFNSVAVEPAFYPLLDLGVLLLRQNPQASVTVVTRTDAVGTEQVNMDVATKRAQAVIKYWVEKGVNPDQIMADPRGEEGTSDDDDEATAAIQRRAEFIITGLLD